MTIELLIAVNPSRTDHPKSSKSGRKAPPKRFSPTVGDWRAGSPAMSKPYLLPLTCASDHVRTRPSTLSHEEDRLTPNFILVTSM